MKLIADSSFLIGHFLKNDSNHEDSEKIIPFIENNDVFITHYILDETITYLNRKINFKNVQIAYYTIIDNFIILDEHAIPNFINNVMNTFNKFEGKLSFTDSTIIESMKFYKIDCLISFDKNLNIATSQSNFSIISHHINL